MTTSLPHFCIILFDLCQTISNSSTTCACRQKSLKNADNDKYKEGAIFETNLKDNQYFGTDAIGTFEVSNFLKDDYKSM